MVAICSRSLASSASEPGPPSITASTASSWRARSSASTASGTAASGCAPGSSRWRSSTPVDQGCQRVDLFDAIPDIAENPEIRRIRRLPATQQGRGRQELEHLDRPAVGDRDPEVADLEDHLGIGLGDPGGRRHGPSGEGPEIARRDARPFDGVDRSSAQPAVRSRGMASRLRCRRGSGAGTGRTVPPAPRPRPGGSRPRTARGAASDGPRPPDGRPAR